MWREGKSGAQGPKSCHSPSDAATGKEVRGMNFFGYAQQRLNKEGQSCDQPFALS